MRLLIIISVMLFSITSWADNRNTVALPQEQQQQLLQQAEKLMAERDYSHALTIYTTLSEQQNPKAEYELGMIHLLGLGVTENPELAVDYFTQSAQKNYPQALFQLGLLSDQGLGTIKDPQQAMKWFTSAARLGHKKAQYRIGVESATGEIIPQNAQLVNQYLLPFAEEGDANAQYFLGKINLAAKNSSKLKQAIQFLTEAAKQNHADAAIELAKAYQTGHGIEENHYQAFYWFNQAAAAGNPDAEYYLAKTYLTGVGTKPNLSKAIVLFNKASEQFNLSPDIAYDLAHLYLKGDPVDENTQTATKLLIIAASGGNKKAQYEVADLYRNQGDMTQALSWYKKAANGGNVESQHLLGYLFYSGAYDTQIDYAKSIQWFETAANNNNVPSMYMLGFQYFSGQGSPTNYTLAYKWFKKAAMLGNPSAQLMLAIMHQEGKSVEKNSIKAYAWLIIAAASSDQSISEKARAYQNELKQQLNQTQLNQAGVLAQTYFSEMTQQNKENN